MQGEQADPQARARYRKVPLPINQLTARDALLIFTLPVPLRPCTCRAISLDLGPPDRQGRRSAKPQKVPIARRVLSRPLPVTYTNDSAGGERRGSGGGALNAWLPPPESLLDGQCILSRGPRSRHWKLAHCPHVGQYGCSLTSDLC